MVESSVDIDLIHIGLGKCMSTSLQEAWSASNDVHHVETRGISRALNNRLAENLAAGTALPPLRLDVPEESNGLPIIVSNEEFTFSFISVPHWSKLLPVKQDYFARELRNRCRKVLMIVRRPRAWLKSAHAQSIRQGGTETYSDFLANTQELIGHMTHLKRITGLWQTSENKLLVLPMELYQEQPDEFLQIMQNELDIPPLQRNKVLTKKNNTDYRRLGMQAFINKFLQHMKMLSEGNPDLPEKQMSESGLEAVRIAGVNRAITAATEGEFKALGAYFGLQEDPSFLNGEIPDGLRKHFQINYIDAIKNFKHMKPWIESYQQDLDRA